MKNCTYVLRALLCLSVCFISVRLSAQTSPFTHEGFTSSIGDYLGFLQYKPSDYDQNPGTKYPVIIFLHGIGERGNGTTELDNITCCGLPRIIKLGHKMRFTWNGKTETFLVIAPQCPVKYGMWPAEFVDDLVKYAKKDLRSDTNRIYLTGLSMGGGGTMRYISEDPQHPKNIAAAATICSPCTFHHGEYVADAKLPLWSFHAEDDPTASVSCTKAAIDKINAAHPEVKPILTLWPTGGHAVWDRVYTDTNYVYQGVLNIYEWFLGQNKSLPVNKLPVAKAGADINITTGTGITTLNASGSTDADGKLVRYVWKKIAGPSAGVITNHFGPNSSTTVTGLTVAGTYQYELTVVDDRAGFTSDTVMVNVTAGSGTPPANKPPVAKAGNDITITLPTNNTTLNGSSSSDEDGTIKSYAWTKLTGPAQFTIASPTAANTAITNLIAGTYTFKLSVTDDKGSAGADTIAVKVNPALAPPNVPPVAKAGNDITITLPTNSTTLNGNGSTDADGTIDSYTWSYISGPSAHNITNANASTTTVTGLTEGTYSFRLLVKDNDAATDADTIKVKVNPAPPPANIPPVAKAGNDITITLPTNNTTLNGNGSTDADGTINSYTWTKLSGPSQYIIANPNTANTALTNLVQGTYTFRLRVTDNKGSEDADTIAVKVNAAPAPPNVAPVAQAGANKTIILPVSSVTLDGGASSDADGTITSYTWSYVSGPSGYHITSTNSISTTVTGLIEGNYSFRLLVKDNDGATDADTVNVKVNAAAIPPPPPNIAPVARVGNDMTITLPTNQVTLNGSASSDADGSITVYAWIKLSGPNNFNIVNPNSSVTDVENLIEGTYYFRLQVKDNDGALGRDTIKVIVNPAPNRAPDADAGADIEAQLPNPTIRLNGLGSNDPDGAIATYDWTRVSGPAGVTITNSTTPTPGVVGVKEGVYIFRLTITDDKGAKSTDDVKLTVLPANAEAIVNAKPLAVAGKNQTIAYPETSAELNGGDSHDEDGSIKSYRWQMVSGPSTPAIISPGTATTQVKDLEPGEYIFELTVTDNNGSTSTSTVTISVVSNLRYEQQLRVYPNPAKADIRLELTSDTTGQAKISIYNISGMMVRSFTTQKGQARFEENLNVANLNAGLYYVEIVIDGKQRMITRFIKK